MSEQVAKDTPAAASDTSLDPMKVAGAAMRLLSEDPRFKVTEAEIRGNTYRVFENAPASLTGLMQMGAAHGDKPFLIYEDEVLSFAQTWDQALRLADGLKKTFGLGKGDMIGLAMRNYPEWCVAYMAITSLGAVSVPLNAWWKTEELEYAVKDSGVKHIIVDARRLEYLAPIREANGLNLILAREDAQGADHLYADILAAGEANPPSADISPEDDFVNCLHVWLHGQSQRRRVDPSRCGFRPDEFWVPGVGRQGSARRRLAVWRRSGHSAGRAAVPRDGQPRHLPAFVDGRSTDGDHVSLGCEEGE